jgi:hypothetical protein
MRLTPSENNAKTQPHGRALTPFIQGSLRKFRRRS